MLNPPRRRAVLLSLIASAAVAGLAAPFPTQERQPNFIVFFIDDLGWADLGCCGSVYHQTPHVDQLAAEGVRFVQGYSACTVCSPSRAALLTGKAPARLHLTDWIPGHVMPGKPLRVPDWTQHLPKTERTLPKVLRSAGYATCHLGKWHLGKASESRPEDHGFDANFGGTHQGQPPSYFSPYGISTLQDGPVGESLTERLTDEALRFIEAKRSQPFFLHFAHYAVHTPLQAKPTDVEAARRRLRPELKQRNPTYAAMVASVDASVGRVRRKLEELGLTRDTVIVFTSDNGGLVLGKLPPTDNSPLRAGKGSAYEGGCRTPWIFCWPGRFPTGALCDAPVITHDLYPTLLELAAIPATTARSDPIDGVSLASLLAAPASKLARTDLFWHYPHYHPGGATPFGAIRSGDWKLIEFYEDGRTELYDLMNDPGERHDLSKAQPDRAAELRKKLADWRNEVGAQMPTRR